MKFKFTYVGGVALVPLLAGAVGGSHALATGACGLITRQEAATALGAPVPAGTETPMSVPFESGIVKMDVCFFGSEVHIARYDLGSGAQAFFAKYRQSLAKSDGYQSVDDVGDEAFAAKGQLYVRKGQVGVNVDVGQARGGGAKELKAEKGLAILALGRL